MAADRSSDEVGFDEMGFDEVLREQEGAWCSTPWEPAGVAMEGDTYRGEYRIDMASDVGERAPYRPLLHASLLAEIVNFHALASVTYAYLQGHHPVLAALPRVAPVEFRRRALLTSLRLSLKEPVFDSPVPFALTLDEVVDKWESHRLVFLTLSVDAANGKQSAEIGACVNFRDAI